jgi:hypothetical protein
MTESPSRIGPTGAPSASTMTIGLMNSSVIAPSYASWIAARADGAAGVELSAAIAVLMMASYASFVRSQRWSRSIA